MTDIGQLVASYYANPLKILLNSLIALVLLAIGIFCLQIAQELLLLAIPGSLLILIAGWLVWTAAQKLRHPVKLHEYGVQHKKQRIPYADFTEINLVESARDRIATPYQNIFKANSREIAITADYWNWQEATEQLKQRIVAQKLETYKRKLEQGELVELKQITKETALGATPSPITLAREGLLLADMTMIGWVLIKRLKLETDTQQRPYVKIMLADNFSIPFNLHNSLEGHLLYQLLREKTGQ